MALATTSSAASQLDMGRLFPCCWPASFCHWVNQSSQFKCKYTPWKDWFYQKLILNILNSCAVQCTLQVLLYCWWYRWPQLPRRSSASVTGWASGSWWGGRLLNFEAQKACPRMLSINKLLPPVSNWGVQGRDADEKKMSCPFPSEPLFFHVWVVKENEEQMQYHLKSSCSSSEVKVHIQACTQWSGGKRLSAQVKVHYWYNILRP